MKFLFVIMLLVSQIFAKSYTEFGKEHFLEKGDEIFIYVYNAHFHSFEDIIQDMSGSDVFLSQCSKLHQIVK